MIHNLENRFLLRTLCDVLYLSKKSFFHLFILIIFCSSVSKAQTGYIYLHKNATNETGSPNFTFNVTGSSFNQNYILNDEHAVNTIRDLGTGSNGRLWATAGAGSAPGIYYRDADASTWTQIAGAAGFHIDGGPGNTHLHSNAAGSVFYYNGTAFSSLGGGGAQDVAMDKNSGLAYHVGSGSEVYYRDPLVGSWTMTGGGVRATKIDIAPNSELVFASNSNANIYISTTAGANIRNLGDPGSTGTVALDVAVADDGVIYATKLSGDGYYVYRYTGGYAAGGSWVRDPTSRMSTRITGGVNGQLWSANGPSPYTNIWARTADGTWINDEPIKTAQESNSVLIPVAPGTYTVTENAVAGWDLSTIDVFDPTTNTTTNIPARTSTVNVQAGEVVHLVYKNYLVQTFAVGNNCSDPDYFENFGTGSMSTVGAAPPGLTNYHYLGTSGETMEDGYYMIASSTVQAGFASQGDFRDHTTGNGTGRMMLVNAAYDRGEFFRRRFTNLVPGVKYSISAWLMSISNSVIAPNVFFEVNDPATGVNLANSVTGDITPFGRWKQYQLVFTATQAQVDVLLLNNNIGGGGNDLALDDIRFGFAVPLAPVLAQGNCLSPTTKQLVITAPLGDSIQYSLDGINYQLSPVFNVTAGTYYVRAKFVTAGIECISDSSMLVINTSECVIPTFGCSNLAYQVTSTGPGINSNLYSYNVSTGTRSLVGGLPASVNAIGYNSKDNYIWGINNTSNQLIRIGSNAATLSYTIPNLPATAFNIGDVIGDGYLFVYLSNQTTYYVIDLDPNRSTYLQLVDPTAGYVLDVAPYGNTFTGASSLAVSDLTYSAATGLLYGVTDPSASLPYRLITVNPVTSAVTIGAAVTGAGVQSETSAYGSAFIDKEANFFYVFTNALGRFYRINIATNTAALLSQSLAAAQNDGAACPGSLLVANISGNVFHDPTAGNVDNSTGGTNIVPGNLYANLISNTGQVVAVTPVNTTGVFGFANISVGTYTVVLSTTQGTVGNPAPSPSLPAGWVNTGEFNGTPNTGNSGMDGISEPFTLVINTTIEDINFAIQRPPVADNKSYALPFLPATNTIINLSAGGNNSSGITPGNLTGTDPEEGVFNSTTALPYGIRINTLPTNGTLIYDGVPVTSPNFYVADYDPTKLQFQFTGTGYTSTSFTYSVEDAAGSFSVPATYTITTLPPFTCANQAYQVTSPSSAVNSTLYSYNVATGVRTLVGGLSAYVNAIGYNTKDNYVWGVNNTSNRIIQIGSDANSISYTIPNLPTVGFNIGDVIGDGYLFVYTTNQPIYYVIDLDPSRSTYLQLVDPSAGYALDTAPYGTSFVGSTGIPVSDLTYSSVTGLLYGMTDPTSATPNRLVTLDPVSRVVVTGAAISGSGIDTETAAYGSTFIDMDANYFFVFTNTLGRFFRINIASNMATLLSQSIPATQNDGAGCPIDFSVLPVSMVSFNAAVNNDAVQLQWTTSSEQNNKGFEIERSADGRNFNTIGWVNSKAVNGNSNVRLSYSYKDNQPLAGKNYYRLKQTDLDGAFAHSEIRDVNFASGNKISVYPNPTVKTLRIDGLRGAQNRILVSDILGKEVLRLTTPLPSYLMDVSKLLPGVYTIRIIDENGSVQHSKMVKE